MPERVQVIVDAKDNASGILRGISQQFGALQNVVQELTGESINWGNLTAVAADLAIQSIKEAIDVTVKYNTEIHNLSLASGQSMEATSRLVQVMDDFGVTTDDILTATRALTREGLAPNIETLAKLSDQYVALNGPAEKNEFIIKNLGRAGLQWAEALSKGGDALKKMNADVAEGLIATQQSYEAAQTYVIALDNWHESIQALQMSLGNTFLPILTEVVNHTLDLERAQALAKEQGLQWSNGMTQQDQKLIAVAASEREAATAARLATDANNAAGQSAANAATDWGKLLSMTQQLNGATREQIRLAGYQALQQAFQASGGGIDENEAKILDQAGVSLGIFNQNAVNSANSINHLVGELASGTITVGAFTDALNAIPTDIQVNVTTTTSTISGDYVTGSCFIPGTLIEMADGSQKAIEDVRPGDNVISYDLGSHNLIVSLVEKVFIHPAEEMGDHYLLINGLGVTPNHQIYAGEWKRADELKVDDLLVMVGGFDVVVSITKIYIPKVTYDLHVADENHNYFANGILVHNKAGGGWATGPGDGSRDTFLAPLANDEFVVNAQDARKNAALLEAINNGQNPNQTNNIYGPVTLVVGSDNVGFLEQR